MQFQWKPGAHIPRNVDAQAVGEELTTLQEAHGGNLAPSAVVRAAESPRSAMHPCFEWDDEKAAEEYRLVQARHLVRSVTVIVERDNREPVVTRAFVSVQRPDEKEKTYVSTANAMADPILGAQVLARVKGELFALRTRYKDLEELAGVFTAIDQLELSAA